MTQPAKNSIQAPLPIASSKVSLTAGLVPAYFTERELFQLKNACRDSDNENAIRFLNAALARAESKS